MNFVVDMLGNVFDSLLIILIVNDISGITLRKRQGNKKTVLLGILCLFVSGMLFLISVLFHRSPVVVALANILKLLCYCVYLAVCKRNQTRVIISTVLSAELVRMIIGFFSIIVVTIFFDTTAQGVQYYFASFLVFAVELIPLLLLFLLERRFDFYKILQKSAMQYAIIVLGSIEVLATQISYYWYHVGVQKYLYISFVSLLMVLSWAILWTINKYLSEREKEELIADNQQLAAQLHKTKEFYPALRQALEKIREQGDSEDLKRLAKELEQFTGQQIQESKYEDMRKKQFPSTGILMLDELVHAYGREAAEKGITFEMYAGSSMDSVLESQKIFPIDFLRLVGDLTRNAFRAVEKSRRCDGTVLLTMGCVDGKAELAVHDNGVPFPLEVLNRLGERGNTQGGTGHGLADAMDYAERYHCTFKLAEYDPDEGFTKGISITWDEKNARLMESDRGSKLADTCIFKTE